MPSAFGTPVTTANRFGAAPAAQSFTLVTTLTASASATLSYTSFSAASYPSYLLILSDIMNTTDLQVLRVQASVNGGSSYPASWNFVLVANSGTSLNVGTAAGGSAYMELSRSAYNGYGVGISGFLYLNFGQTSGRFSHLAGQTGDIRTGDNPGVQLCKGVFTESSPINALKFLFASGNITSGNIKIYGIT